MGSAPNVAHCQRRTAILNAVCCLCGSVAGFKTSLRTGVGRHPFGSGVCLQELRNFLFGKIGAVCAGVAFRNAPAVSKGNHVEIATLGVDNTYCSVVSQASLNDR